MCPFHYVVHHTSIFSTSCLQIHVAWAARKNSGIFQCTLSGLPYPHLRVPGTDLGFRLVPGSSSCGAAWPQLRGPISPLIKVFAQAFNFSRSTRHLHCLSLLIVLLDNEKWLLTSLEDPIISSVRFGSLFLG